MENMVIKCSKMTKERVALFVELTTEGSNSEEIIRKLKEQQATWLEMCENCTLNKDCRSRNTETDRSA